MSITMRREQYNPKEACEHAGLLLDCGFKTWGKDHPEKIRELHQSAAAIAGSALYEAAYQRWKNTLKKTPETSRILEAELENRLYLGMGEASPLEAGVTVHHVYGVPFIPGSAIKGVLHHFAYDVGVDKKICDTIFGREPDPDDKRDSGDAGYIIFNDAWWIPGTKAFIPEIITVHYPNYYQEQGGGGTDENIEFESPNPNPQIAIQGSFLFSVEGDEAWAKYTVKLMRRALTECGLGGKISSGYGVFSVKEETPPDNEVWEKAIIGIQGGNEIKATHPDDSKLIAIGRFSSPKQALGNPGTSHWKKYKAGKMEKTVKVHRSGSKYILKEDFLEH